MQERDIKNVEKEWREWMKQLIANALEQEEAEDYMYEYRWEFIDEESRQLIFRLYILWAAQICECRKEEIEALYRKGYRYIHKLGKNVNPIELRNFDWSVEDISSEEKVVVAQMLELIIQTIEEDIFPEILLNEYDQLETHLKEKVRCGLFLKIIDDYEPKEEGGRNQEIFLIRMHRLFPAVYRDWMDISVMELLFSIREKEERCTKYLEKYLEFHKEDVERIQMLEEQLGESNIFRNRGSKSQGENE